MLTIFEYNKIWIQTTTPLPPTIIHQNSYSLLKVSSYLTIEYYHRRDEEKIKEEIKINLLEPHAPIQNFVEDDIRIVKKWVKHFMQISNVPIILYMYVFLYIYIYMWSKNIIDSSKSNAKFREPSKLVKGYSLDISKYIIFSW